MLSSIEKTVGILQIGLDWTKIYPEDLFIVIHWMETIRVVVLPETRDVHRLGLIVNVFSVLNKVTGNYTKVDGPGSSSSTKIEHSVK